MIQNPRFSRGPTEFQQKIVKKKKTKFHIKRLVYHLCEWKVKHTNIDKVQFDKYGTHL